VGICNDVQGQFVWQITGRGAAARIVPDSGTTLAESSCVACGACVDTCPTGALEDKARLSAAAHSIRPKTKADAIPRTVVCVFADELRCINE